VAVSSRRSERPLPLAEHNSIHDHFGGGAFETPPPTVLLADDDAHITCVVAQKLRSSGFQVAIARDGEEAYELACRLRPAIVVTDLQMPRMSGLDFAVKLRDNPATYAIPVLMLTARGYILESDSLERTNIRQIMGKPFSARELVKRIKETLGLAEVA
jgi:DNA-binding response OmpR family regulator